MSRFRTALAFLLWAIGAAANAQGPPIPTEAQVAVAPQPLPSSAPFLASLDDESAPTPQAAPAAPAASTQPAAPSDAEKTAAAIEKLSKSVETISKNLTVVTADEQIKLVVGGVISADFFWNQARPVAPGIPFFLTPRSPFGFSQATFDANARESTLFAYVSGPKFGDFEFSGVIAACFFNDALIVDRYGILPIQAYGQLKNDDWRFAAGLQFDIFNPLNPNVLSFSYFGGSGNAGVGFPGQLRVERYFHPEEDTLITLTGGLSEPLSTTVNNTLTLSEDNGWPNVEGRAALALGPKQGEGPTAKRPFEIGVSGLVGQLRTTEVATRVVSDVWGLGCDCR
jgi:hypothetical protein